MRRLDLSSRKVQSINLERSSLKFRVAHANHEMKMVRQQGISVGFSYRFDMMSVQSQEVGVIALFAEKQLTVVATIKDMVVTAGKERDGFGRNFCPRWVLDWTFLLFSLARLDLSSRKVQSVRLHDTILPYF